MWSHNEKTLKTVSSASIYLSAFQSNFVNTELFKLIPQCTVCSLLWVLQPTELLSDSLCISMDSTNLHLFSSRPKAPSLGHGSVPNPDNTTHFKARPGRGTIGGNRPRRAPAVPGLDEHWWDLTGQFQSREPLNDVWVLPLDFGTVFPPYHKHVVNGWRTLILKFNEVYFEGIQLQVLYCPVQCSSWSLIIKLFSVHF